VLLAEAVEAAMIREDDVGAFAHADKLSIKELLDIRKEFLGGALRAQTEKADDEVIGQAQTLLEENPDAVKKFLEALDEPVPANV
jgi:uncharacterized protein (DUF1778 family)